MRIPSATSIERLPWAMRASLGCGAACVAVALTYAIPPLRAFPLLLAFPTVVLSAWFLGMWGGVLCALTEAVLVDSFLTKAQLRFSVGNAREGLRLSVFLLISTLLGWAIRRLAEQRAELRMRELQQHLSLANTERQLAEERARTSEALRDRDALLQVALQANEMGLWVWDVKDGTVHWSDEVFRIMGREPGSMQPGFETWTKIIHPDDIDAVTKAAAMVTDGGTDFHMQYRVLWPDGTVRWLESRGRGQRDGDARVKRVVGVLSDVTHRKLAEEAMLRAEKLAIAGRLAASVAHEINNPLEAVSNLLFLVTLAETTETARAHASQALEQLMRVSMITQQTLKFHRQAGTPKITKLSEVMETVLALFRTKLRTADIAVDLQVAQELAVLCMPSETQQIFANLVSNAIDAMPRSGRLTIRLHPSLDWPEYKTAGMRLTLCDSGVGMDRITIHRIFEPFFTTKTETGTGLGMWVVAQLVERHRGQVRVWSTQRDGRSGTAFSVFLPLDGATIRDGTPEAELQSTRTNG